jgi:DnaK suppressor protein
MDKNYYRSKLETEKKELEQALAKIGRVNPSNSHDWQTKPADENKTEFKDEVADQLEDMEERQATEVTLETRLKNVVDALARIEGGTYGICVIGQEAIEPERLEVNPAARTCKAHIDSEDGLDK